MRLLRPLLGVGYLVGVLALAFFLYVASVYEHQEVYGEEPSWHQDVDAWQWDVILALGGAGLLVGLTALALSSPVVLALYAALTGLGVAFVLHADVFNRGQLVLGYLATVCAGALFVYLGRRRS